MTIELELSTEVRESWAILSVNGEVDLSNSTQLKDEIVGLVSAGHPQIVLDLEHVGFMDSTGLGALVTALKKVKEADGALVLAKVPQQIARLLDITGLDGVFASFASLDEAMSR
ncbi:MAG TPA: STAS domain-containing protein [Actinomycetota bacterium]|jgi:anti-sigma B factor antagonist